MVSSWQYYRHWRRVYWLVLLTFFPGVGGIVIIGEFIFRSSLLAFLAFSVWAVAFLESGVRLLGFRCPQCGNPFFSRAFSYNTFAKKCVHCGLPKWTEAGAAESGLTSSCTR